MTVVVWQEADWRRRQRAHRQRVVAWTQPHRDRKRRGETHPVLDFLFTYYSLRPGRLERWFPGPGILLAGDAEEFLTTRGFRGTEHGVCFDPSLLDERRRASAGFIARLLRATAEREPRLSCFGLHEWAMVYRDSPRHRQLPLRLGPTDTDRVVETAQLRCTHHDAFRFFTSAARPLNVITPTREDQVATEQPGCLHANMDLYKWAYKLAPATPSELIADCFELAVSTRELDMRASPYDLSELGYEPVPIETAAGRARYAREQADIAARARPLRRRLTDLADTVAGAPVGAR